MKKLLRIIPVFLGVHGALAMEVDTKLTSSNNAPTNNTIPSLKNLSLHALAKALFKPMSLENIKQCHDALNTYDVDISAEDFKDIMATDAAHLNGINQTLPIYCALELKCIDKKLYSPDNSCIACDGYKGPRLFDIKEQRFYPLEGADAYGLFYFSSKGTYLFQWMSADRSKQKVGVWDTKTRKLIKIFMGAGAYARTTPDERYLILENVHQFYEVYDVATWQKVSDLPHISLENGACFSPDSSRIVIPQITMIDNVQKLTTYVYDLSTGGVVTVLHGGHAVAFSPDGKYIAMEDYDWKTRSSCLHIYNGDGYYPIQKYERAFCSRPKAITFNSDATKVLTESYEDSSVWDMAQGTMVLHHNDTRGSGMRQLLVCDDMTKVVEVDKTSLMVKTLDGTMLQQIPFKFRPTLQRTPNGKHLLSTEWGQGSVLYNLDNLNDRQVISSADHGTSLSSNGALFIGQDELLLVDTATAPASFKDLLATVIKKSETLGSASALAQAIAIKKTLQHNKVKKSRSHGLHKRFVIDDGYTPTVYDMQSDKKLTITLDAYDKLSKNNNMEAFLEKTWNDAENTCSICLEPHIDHITECNHMFHSNCLKTWIAQNKSCPTCRHKLN